ncbi:TPA: restriction endonuclease subunit S [Vibrio cholerae]|jgi:type I restriction enzyme S subunit|nr:restriction endonuclease subunit S [Vibrio fluvialis]HAS4952281.1 restriction endonuclease subunit S [Vibrio cholerae]HAS5298508.1 restriction endonuclease subunit S [Vibrio cholerae]HAS5370523.1 restriction endonuclease subunit S [Vibrio cholerae]HAS5404277.1 restriction endonuclease subunit S [Vibrio cholerae]
MTGRYKAYPEYKDSGIEWLKEMPSHWELIRAKHLFQRIQRPVRPQDGIVTAFRDGEVTLRSNRRTDGFTNAAKEIGYQGVRKGDLLVHAMDGFAGAIGISDSDGKCSPVCSVCIPRKSHTIEPTYFGYLVRQLAVTDYITSLAKGIRERSTEFRFAEFSSLFLAAPPKEEQQKIANFLDHETAKIDTLIAKQEKLIELLKEKRQAVISHAVTKGLNPDAPMKDSGVEWLGEVPEHWVVKRLKFSAKLLASKVAGTDARTIIALENIESSTGRYISTNSSYADDGVVAEAGDVLFGKLRPYLSKVFLCNEPSVAFGDLLAYRPKVGTVAQYLFYSMISGGFIEIVDSSTYGAKMPRASADFINEMRIALPPITEQETIVNQLKDDLSAFDALAVKANDAIKLMQERKTALISAAVTGKIDVSDWELKGDL